MAVSKRLRYEIFRRDSHRCRYCGKTAAENELTVDHVVPTALGGSDLPDNLVTACRDCNAGKSASTPDAPIVDDVAADAIRWAAAMKRAAQLQLEQQEALDEYVDTFHSLWKDWGIGKGEDRKTFEDQLPADWWQTLEQWYPLGVSVEDLKRAIRVTMTRYSVVGDLWKYTCGVVWRQLEARQQLAREIVDQPHDPEPVREAAPIIDIVQIAREVAADGWRYAPSGTHWVDGDLVEDATLTVIPYPDLFLLFDHAYWSAVGAKASWPDVTTEELLWGYPRYYHQFGNGLEHRLTALAATYEFDGDKLALARENIAESIEAGFAEANA